MANSRQVEIDRNYDFFQRNLRAWLKEQRGRYALLRSARVIGFFDRPGLAFLEGKARFPDLMFSIQEVDDTPAEMGLSSFAVD